MNFSDTGLSDLLLRNVAAVGYEKPTEIQQKAIPLVLEGKDITGCAPTGTGKTAAFVLPVLQQLMHGEYTTSTRRRVRCLMLAPTRELAQQNAEAVDTYGAGTGIRALAAYGGVHIAGQQKRLRQGVDIVIATPGRLLDLLKRRSLSLSDCKILVLDEADRMYDMGFIHDVRRIIRQTPLKRQTLLFSATMPEAIWSLIQEVQVEPQRIEIGFTGRPAETVEQHFYSVPKQAKLDLLVHCMKQEVADKTLIFARTKRGADAINLKLQQRGIRTGLIHGDRTQDQRRKALARFRQERVDVLVATDIAARGIDFEGISHVINYDVPEFAEDYIHRIGRTGRADASGVAVTFVSDDEQRHFRRIRNLTGKQTMLLEYPHFTHPVIEAAKAKTAAQSRFKRRYRRPVPRFF
ncbi:MAG: DEAD/DEAH box helicase [Chitinivibrionales bacterium]|nr:DEAD/DEAH box helicase [Chitinivibrionales bacterium]